MISDNYSMETQCFISVELFGIVNGTLTAKDSFLFLLPPPPHPANYVCSHHRKLLKME